MKYEHIDSVRGMAILMVIAIHVDNSVDGLRFIPNILPNYGQMGVQLFFVASAFTLCLSLDNRRAEKHSLAKYAIRRYFRIAPAYYIGLLCYFLLDAFLKSTASGTFAFDEKYTLSNVFSNLFFFHGFVPSANNNIVPGGWSIGTEMAFYVLFPCLFLCVKRLAVSNVTRGLFCIVALVGLSLIVNQVVMSTLGDGVSKNNFYYFNIYNQLPVFMIGICYYELWKRDKWKLQAWQNLAFFGLFSSISIFIWKLDFLGYELPFVPSFTLIPVLSGFSFVFLIELFRTIPALNLKLLRRVGTVSYSMYLIHFVFAWEISGRIAGSLTDMVGGDLTYVLLFLGTTVGSFILALISERVLEKPSVNMGRRLIKRMA